MALMQINVIPLGTGATGVGEYIADITGELRREGIPCRLTDMGTVVEGTVEKLLAVAAMVHEMPFTRGCRRVVTQIVIDDRRDKEVRLGDKVASVEGRLK